jgi:hypothetical protein
MKLFAVFLSLFLAASVFAQTPPVIDVSQAPAPLFDDPVTHGGTDPFVIWNPVKSEWFMYYTQRRSTLDNPNGVDWVHGSPIGIATSPDGVHWSYLGLCKGDHDLSDPLAAKGAGPEPGITWWAPCFLRCGDKFHMWIVRVDGVYTNWTGKRNILHFTSDDGINWNYVSTCALASDRVIDPTVYSVGDLWYMVYKNEAAGSHTFVSQSADLENWTNAHQADPDGSQEGPFAFRWCDKWWLIVDAVSGRGLRIYTSENGIDNFKYVTTILDQCDGTRDQDNAVGHHPGVVVQWVGNRQQCLIYYFTEFNRHEFMQLAELEMSVDGKVFCNRNKFAPPAKSQGNNDKQ